MMNRRQSLRVGLGVLSGFAGAGFLAMQSEALHWQDKVFQGFGTTLRLQAAHTNLDILEQALAAAVRAVRTVEWQMSLFNPESELSRLNAQGHLHQASVGLREVLHLGAAIAERSHGAFDVSTQPLWLAWSDWAQSQSQPQSSSHVHRPRATLSSVWQARIAAARAKVDWRGVHIAGNDVHLQTGMALSLNGIAQGYAAEQAQVVLQAHGVAHALIDTGETALLGHSPQGAWRLGLKSSASNMPVFLPDGRAVASSSDDQTWFSADHHHHHILDPRTGYSPSHWSHVTVLAQRAVVADALTKVFFMSPPQEVTRMAALWGVDVLMQDKTGQWLVTPGVKRLKDQASVSPV